MGGRKMLQSCTQCRSHGRGQREHPVCGASHWEPLTAGLGSLWDGLSPLHQHSFPSGLCTPGQVWIWPLAGSHQHPGAVLQALQKTSPGYQNPAGGQVWGAVPPHPPPGSPRSEVGTTARAAERWWGCTPTPRSASPPPPLRPEGTPGSEGGSGSSRVPLDRDFAPGTGRILLAPAPGTGAGMRGGRRSGAEPPGRRGCPDQNAPPARTGSHEAGYRVGPRPRSQPRLCPRCCCRCYRPGDAVRREGTRCEPVPVAPPGRLRPPGPETEAGSPGGKRGPRGPPSPGTHRLPGTVPYPAPPVAAGRQPVRGPRAPRPRCGVPVAPFPVRGPSPPVQCPRPPVWGPSAPAVGVPAAPQLAPTGVTPRLHRSPHPAAGEHRPPLSAVPGSAHGAPAPQPDPELGGGRGRRGHPIPTAAPNRGGPVPGRRDSPSWGAASLPLLPPDGSGMALPPPAGGGPAGGVPFIPAATSSRSRRWLTLKFFRL